jgi:hypothetical protein
MASAAAEGAVPPRVMTGSQLVDYFMPLFTFAAAGALVTWTLLYTDEEFLLLLLAAVLYIDLSALKVLVQVVAKCNDGLVDSWEQVLVNLVDFARWLLFFMLPKLFLDQITNLLGTQPLPTAVEAVALAAPVLAMIMYALPTMISTTANVAYQSFAFIEYARTGSVQQAHGAVLATLAASAAS